MRSLTIVLSVLTLAFTGCTSQVPTPEDGDPLAAVPLGLDKDELNIPANNPVTAAKVELGRHLYFDKRLSKDGSVACATCHDPNTGWSDGRSTSVGINGQVGGRNAPTIINRAFSTLQFWDGRSPSLEDQALGPVQNPIEMGNTLENMVSTLSDIAGYKPLFKAAFDSEEVTSERVAQAIASFERTVLSGNSPYDKSQAGQGELSESAARGLAIFRDNNKGRCSICHAGFNFTDELYHNIGVGMDNPEWEKNHLGRAEVTKEDKDKGAYKTPTLRQISESGPYMHDGSQKTLEEVVEFYVKGGHPGHPNLDPEMKKLELTDQEKKDLVEFLKALSGDVTVVTAPTPVQ